MAQCVMPGITRRPMGAFDILPVKIGMCLSGVMLGGPFDYLYLKVAEVGVSAWMRGSNSMGVW
jgi:hypothetical protein